MAKLTDAAESKAATPPIGVGTVLAALRRRPFMTVGVVLFAVAAAGVVWKKIPDPKNTGYALFQIQAMQPHILDPQQSDNSQVFRQSQGFLVKSRHVLNSALQDPKVAETSLLRDEPDKIAELEDLIKVDFRTGPEFMRITVVGDDADELRTIIDAVSKSYLDHVVNKRRTEQQARRVELQEYADTLSKKIADTVRKLDQAIEIQSDQLNGSQRFDIAIVRSDLSNRKRDAESRLRDAEIDLDLLKNPNGSQTTVSAATVTEHRRRILDADTSYRALREQLAGKQALVQDMRKALQPGATKPALTAAAAELKDLEQRVKDVENLAQAGAEAAVAKLADNDRATVVRDTERQIERWKRTIKSLETELKELNSKDQRLGIRLGDPEGLRLAHAADNQLLTRVMGLLEILQVESKAAARVSRLESDVLPGVESGKRLKLTAAAGVGFLVLGLAGLVVLERRNPLVLTTQQVTDQLRLPLLGVVPALQGGDTKVAIPAGPGALSDWQMSAMEAVGGTRTLLQYGVSQAAQQARIILVGSAVSGEGKSSVSLLLARSMAQAGNRTLLIDGDLRRPVLHSGLSVPAFPGLCEYLTGKADLAEICHPSDAPDLTVIPAGVWCAAASQALAGPNRWPELVRRVTVEYDYVLIDSSPILPVADALLMARAVDGVLLSVMREVSEVNAVKEALAQLALIGARVLGVVVNGGPMRQYYRPREGYAADQAPATEPAAAP